MRHTIFAILLTVISALSSSADAAVIMDFSVFEKDTVLNGQEEIYKNSVIAAPFGSYRIFTGPLTIAVYSFLEADDGLDVQVEVITLGPETESASEEFMLKKGVKRSFELMGKNGHLFTVEIEGREPADNPERAPERSKFEEESTHFRFSFDEDSYLLFYVPRCIAYFERVDKNLKEPFAMYYPGKTGTDFYEERIPGVYWDPVFPVSFDPASRKISFAYNPGAFPPLATVLSVQLFYQKWRYAHPFIVWGVAGYFEESHFYAAKKLGNNEMVDPSEYFKPRSQWEGEPADYLPFMGSFCRFLIERYGVGKFKDFYQSSTDLTDIKTAIFEHFGVSYETIRDDWIRMLEKHYPTASQVGYYADMQFSLLGDYDRALQFFAYMYLYNQNKPDYGLRMAVCLYNLGDYRKASEVYERIIEINGDTAERRYLLGNAYYSMGEYDKAEKQYERALELDSMYSQAYFKLGDIYLRFDQAKKAREMLRYALGWAPEGGIYSEIYFRWGDSYRRLKEYDTADSLYELGLYYAKTKVAAQPDIPVFRMLLAEAFINSNQPDSALVQLDYLKEGENRAYYIGRTYLNLGKAYDLLGNHDQARTYYKKVQETNSAAYHKKEAKGYEKKPFKPVNNEE